MKLSNGRCVATICDNKNFRTDRQHRTDGMVISKVAEQINRCIVHYSSPQWIKPQFCKTICLFQTLIPWSTIKVFFCVARAQWLFGKIKELLMPVIIKKVLFRKTLGYMPKVQYCDTIPTSPANKPVNIQSQFTTKYFTVCRRFIMLRKYHPGALYTKINNRITPYIHPMV